VTVDFKQLILTSTLVQELGVFFARSSVLYEFSIVLENNPTSSDMTTRNIFEKPYIRKPCMGSRLLGLFEGFGQ